MSLSSEQVEQRLAELRELLRTFDTEGWRFFSDEVEQWREALIESAPADCPTGESWLARRAIIQNLEHILSYQERMVDEYDTLTNPPEFDDTNPLEI